MAKTTKRKAKTPSPAPLFIEIEGTNLHEKVKNYVRSIIREYFPELENAQAMAVEVSGELLKLKLKTLSLHLVNGYIKNRITELTPGVSKEGYPLPVLSDNALTVLKKRYLKKDENRRPIEKPYTMFRRVAETIAKADAAYGKTKEELAQLADHFYEIMVDRTFIPNSPTLMNAGRSLGQLSACFVLPIEDSMDSIFEAVKNTALIHKSGGGTGFSFSRLRPTDDRVRSTKGVSSGPISFIKVFDAATETIKQGGTRRGANMAILRIDHPNIVDFITCKSDLTQLNNFNISVGVTDKFMKALEAGADFSLVNPRTGKPHSKIKASKLFDLMVSMSWANGEPGMVFIDRINACNPTKEVGDIEATNPCGEQPLLPYESCNLGSLNLALMIDKGKVNFDLLENRIKSAVHFLDNVIDANKYPLDQIRDQTLGNRKIGLGIMGWADMLVQLDIAYDSKKALSLAKQVMAFIQETAFEASCALAQQRGPFPNIEKSIYAKNPADKQPRNATTTTIAPTGTISIIAGASSGIEPIFAISFFRRVLDGEKLVEINPYFELMAKKEGFYSEQLMETIAQEGTIQDIPNIPDRIKKIFVTSHDIEPKWHVKMQAAFQAHTDNAVSKTVNFPENATPAQIANVFKLAYETGCKGITVYRYGSRESVLQVGNKTGETNVPAVSTQGKIIPDYDSIDPRSRLEGRLVGITDLVQIGCGKLYVTVNTDNVGICEVFTTLGRSGGCPSQSEATVRLASLALRSGIKIESIIEQLRGIRCHSATRKNDSSRLKINNGERAVSCPAAIANALEMRFKDNLDEMKGMNQPIAQQIAAPYEPPEAAGTPQENEYLKKGMCPDCGSEIEHAGGCVVCHSCGYSKCG